MHYHLHALFTLFNMALHGSHRIVWVNLKDSQTQGLVVDGRPWIVQDGLGNFGVRGYSDTGVGGGWTSMDCPGWSG